MSSRPDCCNRYSFETEIIKIGQSSHKLYSNNILNFQESTTTLNACTKKSGILLNAPRILKILTQGLTDKYTITQRTKKLKMIKSYTYSFE